ncbi:hypothetical protein [uncultured Sphingomonas sp.]|uniref:hypothetical protein n=1 Tax=uncultured Sphingomonas sp. TaxID=158754 RepID=UPI002636C982|nr:hypothetical protein [uncultured Sphingomonas sp.]
MWWLAVMAQAMAPVMSTPPRTHHSSEALMLARRLAQTGTLTTIIPLMVEKDLSDLVAEDKTLTPAERAQVQAKGRELARAKTAELIERMAAGYAARLSLADLRQLAAAAASPAAARKRAADLPITLSTMQAIGPFDLKKQTAAATCAAYRLLCARD